VAQGKDTSSGRPILLGATATAAAQDFDFNDDEQEGDEEKLIGETVIIVICKY
jgi:hypothetical protein